MLISTSDSLPEPVNQVADIMAGFGSRWFLCGGWAVDAWLGRQTRDHHDIEVAIFQDDQRAIFDHLTGWQLIGHDANVADDSQEPWRGRHLELPSHIHGRSSDGFNFEVHLNERSGEEWVFSRGHRVTLPVSRCWHQSAWGIPAVSPEVILYYKALPPAWRDLPRPDLRPHDELDLIALLPVLTGRQRRWLQEAIAAIDAGHPWLMRLSP